MKFIGRKDKKTSSGWEYAGLGFEFVGMFLFCTAIGWWLDTKFWPGKQWLMLAGIFLGFAAGLYHILLRTSEIEKNEDRIKPEVKAQKKEKNDTKIKRLESEMEDVGSRIEQFIEEESYRKRKK